MPAAEDIDLVVDKQVVGKLVDKLAAGKFAV